MDRNKTGTSSFMHWVLINYTVSVNSQYQNLQRHQNTGGLGASVWLPGSYDKSKADWDSSVDSIASTMSQSLVYIKSKLENWGSRIEDQVTGVRPLLSAFTKAQSSTRHSVWTQPIVSEFPSPHLYLWLLSHAYLEWSVGPNSDLIRSQLAGGLGRSKVATESRVPHFFAHRRSRTSLVLSVLGTGPNKQPMCARSFVFRDELRVSRAALNLFD